MNARALILFMLVAGASQAAAQSDSSRPVSFEGYVLADSLEYSAETIDYYFGDRKIVLDNNANVNYLGRILTSSTITYYQDFEYMEALGKEDTTGTLINTPTFTDVSGERLDGTEIKYDIGTQEGLVLRGRTTYEQGYMTAGTIKRVSADTLYISDGTYTTCDNPDPHYYFYGRQMKFIVNDKLIIKPIIAYLEDIPVLWFPFYVFPIARGRQSGFLMPRYGESRDDGRYFSNIGYYFAPSEYFDYRFSGTVRERNGWLINNWFSYNRRYLMSGSLFGSFENEPRLGVRQWKLTGSHRQTISPTLNMTGTMNLQSSEFSRNNEANLYQVLNRNVRSSLRITKQWRESGNSLIVTMDHSKNLDSQSRTSTLPDISFRKPNKLLFSGDGDSQTLRKYAQKSTQSASEAERPWYRTIYYSFNTSFKNTESNTYSKSPEQRQLELLNPGIDKYDVHDFASVKNLAVNTQLTSSQKLWGWLTMNPSLSLRENFEASTDSVGYARTDNISLGIDLSTKVFGTFDTAIGTLRGLRHVISPSVSYSHGLRRSYEGDESEVLFRFDKNDIDDPQSRRLSVNLRNIFQAKTIDGETERKYDLFSLDFSTAVDFERPERRVSPLSTTLDVKPVEALKILVRSTHDLYDTADEFRPFSPTLTSLSVTTTLGLTDRNVSTMQYSSRVNANKNLGRDVFDTDIDDPGTGMETAGSEGGSAIPFNIQIQHFYSRTRVGSVGSDTFTERHTLKPTVSFSPTRNFSIQYFTYYDIKEKALNDQRITLKRDLHCWEANLYWVITGIREGFYLKINIKDLPDVKIEQRRGVSVFSG